MVGDLYSQFNEAANYTRKFIFKIQESTSRSGGTPLLCQHSGDLCGILEFKVSLAVQWKLDEITNWDPLSEYLGMLRVQIPECRKEHSQAAVLQGKRWAVFAKERFL